MDMSRHIEENMKSVAEFNKTINLWTLSFKDPKTEANYREKRVDILFTVTTFKILFIILAALVAIRRIEAFIFALTGIQSSSVSLFAQYLNVGILVFVCLLEAAFVLFKKLRICMGFLFILYIFTMTPYSAYSISSTDYCGVPT